MGIPPQDGQRPCLGLQEKVGACPEPSDWACRRSVAFWPLPQSAGEGRDGASYAPPAILTCSKASNPEETSMIIVRRTYTPRTRRRRTRQNTCAISRSPPSRQASRPSPSCARSWGRTAPWSPSSDGTPSLTTTPPATRSAPPAPSPRSSSASTPSSPSPTRPKSTKK